MSYKIFFYFFSWSPIGRDQNKKIPRKVEFIPNNRKVRLIKEDE